jgi:AraC-like DNA-binding protein
VPLQDISVGEYIRFRRLSCAAEELGGGEANVTELAFRYGYETVESFSKAFNGCSACSPSKYPHSDSFRLKFSPIKINFDIMGGFSMERNVIPGLGKVDWSDRKRQNEFVNSVVSALNALGENLIYDTVCAVSGSAFRTSFSVPTGEIWNHGNYHVLNTPAIIGHTFTMLGYKAGQHAVSQYTHDKRLIMDSIDRGVPAITLHGVINCADACLISGYDNGGAACLVITRLCTSATTTTKRPTIRGISENPAGTKASSPPAEKGGY